MLPRSSSLETIDLSQCEAIAVELRQQIDAAGESRDPVVVEGIRATRDALQDMLERVTGGPEAAMGVTKYDELFSAATRIINPPKASQSTRKRFPKREKRKLKEV